MFPFCGWLKVEGDLEGESEGIVMELNVHGTGGFVCLIDCVCEMCANMGTSVLAC